MALARALQSGRRSIEPWYLAYGLVGAATGGIAPILLPLAVNRAGDASHVGLVIAAVGLGGLSAALWGDLADRLRWHRLLFGAGSMVGALALAAFGATTSVPLWLVFALLLGVAQSAANTVASLFVVEAHPQAEWDARIGWLQTFYNAGIVAGLVVAGTLSQLPLDVGLLVGAGAFALAGVFGWLTTRTPPSPGPTLAESAPAAARRSHRLALAAPHWHALHVEWAHLSPLRLVHHPRRETFARLEQAVRSPFGLFLAVWVVANLGVNAVYALYPLLVQNVYGIQPGPSSFALAAATGLGLLLFTPASLLTHRLGGARVLQAALGVRLVMLLALLALVGAAFPARDAVVLVAFAVISLAFPLMSVSSTVLTSSLSPVGQGEGMGIYTSVGALAGLVGAVLGGWAANTAGYPAALVIAAASVVLALLLSAPLRPAPAR